jgi:hypothetical protein
MDFVAAFFLGALIGGSELVARYRDAPARVLWTLPAGLYIGLNGVAAALALTVVRGLDVRFGLDEAVGADSVLWIQILTSGIGAMAVFRSSVFSLRVGEQDISIGPSSFLQIILGAADRSVDRLRARARAEKVAEIMDGVAFGKAEEALPAYCLALMQNLPQDDQKALGEEIGRLSASTMDEETKALVMGLALMNTVGPGVLQAAVDSLADRIKQGPELELAPEP